MSKSIVKLARVRDLTKEETAPPQCLAILAALPLSDAKNPTWVEREELAAQLEGKFATRQPIERIVAYYQPALEKAGLIVVDRASKKVNVIAKARA